MLFIPAVVWILLPQCSGISEELKELNLLVNCFDLRFKFSLLATVLILLTKFNSCDFVLVGSPNPCTWADAPHPTKKFNSVQVQQF